jgi:hypothetical protein
MHARTLAFLLAVPAVAGAQEPPTVRPPRALVAQLWKDLSPDDDFRHAGIDSLAAGITVERRDFNGDGVPEWLVVGTRFCRLTCGHWIYRRLAAGGYARVHQGGGIRIDALPARSHGWHNLVEYWYAPCCGGISTTHAFDGRRYRWRETRVESFEPPEHLAYRLTVTGTRPRRLALDPVDAGRGTWLSARYDLCSGPGGRCGAPELRLSSSGLPAGRACATLRLGHGSVGRPDTLSLCGTTVPGGDAPGRTTRTLVLRPGPEEWGMLLVASTLEIGGGPGLPGRRVREDAEDAVRTFADRLAYFYRLTCAPGLDCDRTEW